MENKEIYTREEVQKIKLSIETPRYKFVDDGSVEYSPGLLAFKVRIGNRYYIIEPTIGV